MPVELVFRDLDLKPAGGVTRVGPVRLSDYAAVTAQIDFARSFGGSGAGVPTDAVFTLKTGVAGSLATIDSTIVSSQTVAVGGSTRIKDCEQVVGDLYLQLTTEDTGGSPPYRGDLTVTIRTRQDELEGRGSESPAARRAVPGADKSGGPPGGGPPGGGPGGTTPPSGGDAGGGSLSGDAGGGSAS